MSKDKTPKIPDDLTDDSEEMEISSLPSFEDQEDIDPDTIVEIEDINPIDPDTIVEIEDLENAPKDEAVDMEIDGPQRSELDKALERMELQMTRAAAYSKNTQQESRKPAEVADDPTKVVISTLKTLLQNQQWKTRTGRLPTGVKELNKIIADEQLTLAQKQEKIINVVKTRIDKKPSFFFHRDPAVEFLYQKTHTALTSNNPRDRNDALEYLKKKSQEPAIAPKKTSLKEKLSRLIKSKK